MSEEVLSIVSFIDQVEELGFEVELTNSQIFIYYLHGRKLQNKTRVAQVSLIAECSYRLYDPYVPDKEELAKLVNKFGCQTRMQRGNKLKKARGDDLSRIRVKGPMDK